MHVKWQTRVAMQDRTCNRKMMIVSYFWLSREFVHLIRGPGSMSDASLATFIRDNEGENGIVKDKKNNNKKNKKNLLKRIFSWELPG